MHDQKLGILGKHAINEKPTFRGRRHGRKLRPQLDKLFKENLHTFLVEEGFESDGINLNTFFSVKPKKFWLEIGFGGGEHLAWQAKFHPQIGILGFEPYINGVASLVRHLVLEKLSNVSVVKVLACVLYVITPVELLIENLPSLLPAVIEYVTVPSPPV